MHITTAAASCRSTSTRRFRPNRPRFSCGRARRARWPRVDILIRGDSHYGRPEAMAWCERNRVGYIFGLAGNKVLLRCVTASAEQVALDRLDAPAESKVRRYAEFWYGAKTW